MYGIWGITGAILLVPFVLLVPETRGGVILAARAQRARKAGRPGAWAIHEKLGRRTAKQIVQETVLRPASTFTLQFVDVALVDASRQAMLLTEPIVYCFALYDGLNYGIIVR